MYSRQPILSSTASNILILAVSFAICVAYSCSRSGEESTTPADRSIHHGFVGEQVCQSCHTNQTAAWRGSHHDYAMRTATGATVRGDFSGVRFTHNGETFHFYREDSLYMVDAPGADGTPIRYRVTHTFGWEPLQQYLIDFGRGKLQVLNIAWDTDRETWFALNPEDNLEHGDWLHWSGGAMNWNSMCADCHSTDLRQNYIVPADSFQTTWASINVGCEACHGPGREHVAFMTSDASARATLERIRQDLQLTTGSSQVQQINQCAQCHSLREELNTTYDHTGDFLDHFSPGLPQPPQYFADGQIKEEVYVYGSFLQSKMYANGVKCDDCHDPHTLRLKANVTDNSLCMTCHLQRYNTPDHTFHELNTEASRCISCHMPGRYYMEVDFRRDHSFRVPRPDISAKAGTPNACNSCHENQTAEWASDAVEQWYGPQRSRNIADILILADSLGVGTFTEIETALADTTTPDIVKAILAWNLGRISASQSVQLLGELLNSDPSPIVRSSAARVLASLPVDLKQTLLQDGLDDSVRAVRLAAAGGLAELSVSDITFSLKSAFTEAIAEYEQYLETNSYFPQGQMNRGQYYEKRGEIDQAIQSYRQALQIDPAFNAARLNLAFLYNRQGNNATAEQLMRELIEQEPGFGQGHYSLALLLAEENRLQEALDYFESGARLMPGHARLRYNWAITLQTIGRTGPSEERYLDAIELDPEAADYRYGICTLYVQSDRYPEALPHALKLAELQPNSPRAQNLLEMVRSRVQE